jgi:TolB-like protein/class 3 adenylate cyclase/Tfp pilus assembly protein PilF
MPGQVRQLAAIMFTDIVGYTTLMGKDEQKAFDFLRKNREIHKPFIEEFNGRFIKELGDGILAVFPTVSDAVLAAIRIQQSCKAGNEFQLRIGIHQGEVVIEDNDVFGDAVNIASRIQTTATAGSIYVSEVVHHNVSNKTEIETEFVKTENLKNVKEPVRIYRVKLEDFGIPSRKRSWTRTQKSYRLLGLFAVLAIITYLIWEQPWKSKKEQRKADATERSIAVLPFANLSNDPNQEYFSDGLSEELLNLLTKVPELKVIGRTSSSAFKGKKEDLRNIGEQLGANYLLQGSVRKDSNRIRITAQLIRASDGSQLWSDSWDKQFENIFQVQEEISYAVIQKLRFKLLPISNVSGSGNVDAYNLILQGNYYFDRLDKENVGRAVELYKQALAIDSTNARAWVELANAISRQAWQNYIDRAEGRKQAKAAALKAIQLDSTLPGGYLELGDHYLYSEFNWKAAEENFLKGLKLDPDNSDILYSLGGGLYFAMGKWDDAIKYMKRSIDLDPLRPISYLNLGNILTHAGRMAEANPYLRKALELDPEFQRAHMYIGRNFLLTRKIDSALNEMPLENMQVFRTFGLALAYHTAGRKKDADEMLDLFRKNYGAQWIYLLAELYAFRQQKDEAFVSVENAYQENDGWLVFLKGDPLLRNLKADLRYKAFMQKMNLPPDE